MSAAQLSMLGQLWLNAYYQSIGRYTSSTGRDVGSYCAAAYQLKSFLERCPEQASLARQLALSQMTLAHHSAPHPAMILLGDTALRASLVAPLEKASEAAVLRDLLLATSHLKEQRLFDALDQLNRCRSHLSQLNSTPLGRWATAKEALLRGDLSLASFELKAAKTYYGEAYNHAESLLADAPALNEFSRTWVDLVAPPGHSEDLKRDLEAEPRWEVKYIALRSVQTAAAITRDAGRADPISKVLETFGRIGRVQFVRPLLLVQVLASLPPGDRISFCALLREIADSRLANHFAARGGQPPTELLERLSDLTQPDESEHVEIDVVERLAEIESHLIARDLSQAKAAWDRHIRAIAATPMSFSLLYAFGQQLRFAGEEDLPFAFQQFLQILGGVVFENSDLLLDPQYRSMIDSSIEAAMAYAVDSLGKDARNTTAVSALLALQRSPRVTVFPRLLGFPEHKRTTAEKGIETLADTLTRIQLGLSRWGDAVVLITQRRPAGLVFLCWESMNGTPRVINAGQSLTEAMNDLDRAATKSEGSKATWIHTALEEKGRDAFNALPEHIRVAISKHNTLLLVPDYSAGHDALPFELMHNGDGYLLSERVIARFTSLQQLAETFDKRTRTPGKRRALVIGIDNAKDVGPLPLAETERKDVCCALTDPDRGFDVPIITADRVTSRFITDRLSFVDVLHVAGHGETAVGAERLILSDGSWLDSTDLERRPQSSLPFVYLNTCELGETRFLGGGRGRGLAFTFAELGAPAVMAHTKPVFDDVSAALAKTFYRESLQSPVGEALRRARKELLKTYPASDIARLVLLGNPKHALPGVQELAQVDDPTDDLLDKYFDLDASRDERSEVLTYLLNHGLLHGARLEAAACLVWSREEAMHANASNDPVRLRDAIALSEALNHRRSAALFKLKVAQLSVTQRAPDSADRLRAALQDLNVLARVDSRWEEHRKRAVAMLLEVDLAARGIDMGRLNNTTEEDPDMLRGFVSAVAGAETLWEVDVPRPRVIESTLEDILWNAVLAGDRHRLEAVPEKLVFTTALIDKLIKKGHLPGSPREFALPILVAVFAVVWSARNDRWSSRQCATAQMRLIEGLVRDVATSWSPPDSELERIVGVVPRAIDAALAKVKAVGYLDGYEILQTEMAAVRMLAERTIQSSSTKYPDTKDASVAFVAGCFMTKNTFEAAFQDSYTPERLSAIFDELSADLREHVATSCAALESDKGDDLIRWRREDTERGDSGANDRGR